MKKRLTYMVLFSGHSWPVTNIFKHDISFTRQSDYSMSYLKMWSEHLDLLDKCSEKLRLKYILLIFNLAVYLNLKIMYLFCALKKLLLLKMSYFNVFSVFNLNINLPILDLYFLNSRMPMTRRNMISTAPPTAAPMITAGFISA